APETEMAARLTAGMTDRPAPGAGGGPVPPVDVALLFTPEIWADLIPRASPGALFRALVGDRPAMLLHYGLAASDPGIHALVTSDSDLLRWMYRNAAGATALAGASLRLVEGAIEVPGGPDAEPIWEALAGESPRAPASFLRALLSRDQGRLAWFFDTLHQLDPPRLAAIYGNGPPDARRERIERVYGAFRGADPNWLVEARPFTRTQADAWAVVTRVAYADGVVAPPNDAGLWAYVFGRSDLSEVPPTGAINLAREPVGIDWLAPAITSAELRARRDRLEQVQFAQRVFGDAPAGSDGAIAFVLVNYPRYRAAVLSAERVGLGRPADYAALVLAARHVDGLSGARRRDAIVAFQGALAVIGRARWAGTLDEAAATRAVTTLSEAATGAADVPVAVSRWLVDRFLPALPRLTSPDALTGRTAYEARLLQGMAGLPDAPDRPALAWEGLDYVVDPAAAEFARLREARARLESPGLDAAIAHPRAAGLGDALLAIVYAAALGDPEGPAFFSRDVPARHDFAFDSPSSQRRAVVPWTVPREAVADGGPWRGLGALVGLDLAMARLALRRIVEQDMPQAPSIGANDAQVFSRTVVLLGPRVLTDAARDEVVAAIGRGRARVGDAGRAADRLDRLAAEAGVSPWTRALLPWMAAHDPGRLDEIFTRRDLLWLGRPALDRRQLDLWGAYAEPVSGCLCALMPAPEPWEWHTGRAESGHMATQAVDLLLRIAEETHAMSLPALVIPPVMAYAVQDYLHAIEARIIEDWRAMARAADALERTRIEDYVAALAGTVLQPR
ncbi:MAG: hypothetical protein ACLGHP_03420, partial [Vicinamibacteria bacterium]